MSSLRPICHTIRMSGSTRSQQTSKCTSSPLSQGGASFEFARGTTALDSSPRHKRCHTLRRSCCNSSSAVSAQATSACPAMRNCTPASSSLSRREAGGMLGSSWRSAHHVDLIYINKFTCNLIHRKTRCGKESIYVALVPVRTIATSPSGLLSLTLIRGGSIFTGERKVTSCPSWI